MTIVLQPEEEIFDQVPILVYVFIWSEILGVLVSGDYRNPTLGVDGHLQMPGKRVF